MMKSCFNRNFFKFKTKSWYIIILTSTDKNGHMTAFAFSSVDGKTFYPWDLIKVFDNEDERMADFDYDDMR